MSRKKELGLSKTASKGGMKTSLRNRLLPRPVGMKGKVKVKTAGGLKPPGKPNPKAAAKVKVPGGFKYPKKPKAPKKSGVTRKVAGGRMMS